MAMDEVLDIGLSDNLSDGVRSLGVIGIDETPADVQELVDRREAARIARNWAEADTLRQAVSLKGYNIEDTPLGPKLSKVE
jgi:cysteinyl-tRNA synthetase